MRSWLATFLLLPLCCSLPAQTRIHARGGSTPLVFGQAAYSLVGPWRFHTGDDLRWAQPTYPDLDWGTMDLITAGAKDPILGFADYIPGWTARGYPGYHGFAWYRLSVPIADPHADLWIEMTDNADDGYQLYANGSLIGELGNFHSSPPRVYTARGLKFHLPPPDKSGNLHLAIRVFMSADDLVEAEPGGLHAPPVIGLEPIIQALERESRNLLIRTYASTFLFGIPFAVLAGIAFALYRFDPTEPAYAWLGAACSVAAVQSLYLLLMEFSYLLPNPPQTALFSQFLPFRCVLWVVFWAYWFHLEVRGLRQLAWVVGGIYAAAALCLTVPLFGGVIPIGLAGSLTTLTIAARLALAALMLSVTVLGLRKDRTEALLALLPIALVSLGLFQSDLQFLHLKTIFFPLGLQVSISSMGGLLSVITILALLLRRFIQALQKQQSIITEVRNARQVQQVLIPEKTPVITGFTIQNDYCPAAEVGGDFFQVIPVEDGSILAIIGDVSGKGVQAALLVALIIGTIRTLVEYSSDPVFILRGVNRRLCGRHNVQFATCLAVLVHPDGACLFANAGHLAPYINGREVPVVGSLPLGILEDAQAEVHREHLEEGDALLLITDGIVEAQDESGKLFGFERTAELIQQGGTASAVAEAARKFGQRDDITVLRIERTLLPDRELAAVNS